MENAEIKIKEITIDSITINYKKRLVDRELLLSYIEKDTVVSYCKECNNYGKVWSCPPKTPTFSTYLQKYKNAEILLFSCDVDNFKSKKKPVQACYETLKKIVYKKLMKREEKKEGRVILPFSCSLCSTCKLAKGEKCKHPKDMRYNLTGFGFNVQKLSADLMDHTISWQTDKQESEYITQVAILLY